MQLKLFLTRLGENGKMIVTGDPCQSDLHGPVALTNVVERLKKVQGIGVIEFNNSAIVRHPLVGKILESLD
jgi:phosphate starvation-inducible PhoH-like protein